SVRVEGPWAPASFPRSWSNHGNPAYSNPASQLRSRDTGSLGRRDREDGEADRSPDRGSRAAADAEVRVHGAAFAARGQEVARAVRDAGAQAPDRHLGLDPADDRRLDE